jgi:ABC-type uncharacterized transport system involved in gliding motility auxiliary subunit
MNINRQEISKLAGIVGPALAVAGYILYTRVGEWKWHIIALIAVGGALLLASIVLNFRLILEFFRGRQGKLGANTAVLSVAVIAIIGVFNYAGSQWLHKRIDMTTEGLYTLSDQTRKIVGGLQKDVKVIKFANTEDQPLADLMSEFKYVSNRISYQLVDPSQKPETARQYAAKRGETIVAVGERIERPQQTDEQAMVNAILKVTRDKLKRVCFTKGHEERSVSDTENSGYALVDGQLKNENYETKEINLATSAQVPAECEVLVVAGPKKSLVAEESASIGKYLDGGGKVFLLLEPNTDPQIGDVLNAWNIKLGNDLVLCGPQTGLNRVYPAVLEYPEHPITKDLRSGNAQTFYLEARSVKPGDSAGAGIQTTEILKTLEGTWGETQLTELKDQPPKYDAGKDIEGPVSIGVAASKKVGEKEARLVVIGDSDFATNGPIRMGANGNVFFNSVNWLAQDEDLISIRPKSTTTRSLIMTDAQQTMFKWLAVLFMPLAAVGAGAYIWWNRR